MKKQDYNLKVILLAAGKSERFNGVKVLAKVQQKETSITLIEHAFHQISLALNELNIDDIVYSQFISSCLDKLLSE